MDEDTLLILASKLGNRYGYGTLLPPVEVPSDSYDERRGQYDSARFLELAMRPNGDRVLGITYADLFVPGLNFVFGRALLGGKACVISIARLRHAEREVFISRVVKEAVHELGHTFGLDHCKDQRCVMFFSNSISDTDRKGDWYCDRCGAALNGTGGL